MSGALQPTQKAVDTLDPSLQPLRALLASIGTNHTQVPRQQGANYAPAAPNVWDQLYKGQNAQSNNGTPQKPDSLFSTIIPLLAAWQAKQNPGAAPVAAQNNPAPGSAAAITATMNPNTPKPISMSPSAPVNSTPATLPVDTGTRFVPPTNIPISIDPTGTSNKPVIPAAAPAVGPDTNQYFQVDGSGNRTATTGSTIANDHWLGLHNGDAKGSLIPVSQLGSGPVNADTIAHYWISNGIMPDTPDTVDRALREASGGLATQSDDYRKAYAALGGK